MNTRSVAVLAAVLLASLLAVKAQESDKVYLDEVLASTSKKTAKYYRVLEGQEDHLFIGRTYTIDGKLKSEGTYADSALRVEHGSFTFFHTNGAVESKGEYVMGNKSGVWERYTPAGEPLAEKIYNHVPLENIVYTLAEMMPKNPKGSEKEFIRYIKSNVTSSKGKRIKGTMTASFIVEKNGMLSDVKILGGKDAEVDKQVVKAISDTQPWQAGTEKGQPVRVMVRIPVQF